MGILGQRFCRGLAEFGAQVAVVDLDLDRCTAFAAELERDYGTPALGVACDVSDPASVANMVDQVVKRFGAIHILHNNAASKSADLDAFFASTEKYSLHEWRKIMSVNVDGMFLVAQAVGGQMQKQGTGGSIIQTASIYGLVSSDKRIYEGSFYLGRQISNPAVYSTSKAAVVGLTVISQRIGVIRGFESMPWCPLAWRADKTRLSRRAILPAFRWPAWPSRMKWSARWFISLPTPRAMLPAIALWSMAVLARGKSEPGRLKHCNIVSLA